MRDSFGARLRRKREEQRIALSAIAADTKIKLSLLEGLEQDDMSGWPSGIFRRAYVRAYARAIGLAPDEVVTEFTALYPEPDASDAPLSASFPKSAEPESWRERIWQFGRRGARTDVLASTPLGPPAPTPAEPEAPATVAVSIVDPPPPIEQSAPTAEDLPVDAPDVVPVDAPSTATAEPSVFEPDLAAVAALCTALGQVADANDLAEALDAAAALVNASGLIIWTSDAGERALVPAFAHGYAPRVLAQLQPIGHDSDNATAAAFRSGEISVVKRTERQNGALVAPLMRAGGCAGTLAIELRDGAEQLPAVHHLVRIVAAQLATLIEAPATEEGAEEQTARDERGTRSA